MIENQELYERLSLVAKVNPQLADNTALNSDWINMEDFRRALFIVMLGATDITVDAKLQKATDGSGTGAADITGKSITQFSATDDNKQALIHIRAEELGTTFTHVRCVVTIADGTTGANVAVAGLGADMRYSDGRDIDLASVAQVIT